MFSPFETGKCIDKLISIKLLITGLALLELNGFREQRCRTQSVRNGPTCGFFSLTDPQTANIATMLF